MIGYGVAVVRCGAASVVGATFGVGTFFLFGKLHVRFFFFLIGGFLWSMMRLVGSGLS